ARARGLPPREGAGRRVAAVDGLSVAARAGTHPARPAPRLAPAGQRGERGAAHALGPPVPDRRRWRCRHLRGAVPRLDAGRTGAPRSGGARGAARPRPGVLVPAGRADSPRTGRSIILPPTI